MSVDRRQRWAQAGIVVQFLALVRTLGEFFRLRHLRGAALTLAEVEPYVVGATITAVLCFAAVVLYFARRHTTAVAVAAATVLVLLVYRFTVMG